MSKKQWATAGGFAGLVATGALVHGPTSKRWTNMHTAAVIIGYVAALMTNA
jgi:hypothetical protein